MADVEFSTAMNGDSEFSTEGQKPEKRWSSVSLGCAHGSPVAGTSVYLMADPSGDALLICLVGQDEDVAFLSSEPYAQYVGTITTERPTISLLASL